MLVRDRMITNVFTVTGDTSLERAMSEMRIRHIRRLPVLQDGHLIGIVTWTDLMRAQPSSASTLSRWEIPALLEKAPVREVMTRSVETVPPDTPLEEAATIMRRRKIGGLPVVKNGTLMGIVTESDIFDAFISLLGARYPSYRITLDVDDSAAGPSRHHGGLSPPWTPVVHGVHLSCRAGTAPGGRASGAGGSAHKPGGLPERSRSGDRSRRRWRQRDH